MPHGGTTSHVNGDRIAEICKAARDGSAGPDVGEECVGIERVLGCHTPPYLSIGSVEPVLRLHASTVLQRKAVPPRLVLARHPIFPYAF
jgi:hypothetical protein